MPYPDGRDRALPLWKGERWRLRDLHLSGVELDNSALHCASPNSIQQARLLRLPGSTGSSQPYWRTVGRPQILVPSPLNASPSSLPQPALRR